VADVQAEAFRESLLAGGECGRLIASRDWSRQLWGQLEAWPSSLRTATSILLRSPVPIVMLWGEDGVMLYNDAYSVFAGGRHPQLLGCKVREGWPEVADFNDNVMKVGLAGGTLAYRDQELTLYRHGAPEQVFMNLDYSPVLDESGRPAGVLAIVVETTNRVLAERRLASERERLVQMHEQAPASLPCWKGRTTCSRTRTLHIGRSSATATSPACQPAKRCLRWRDKASLSSWTASTLQASLLKEMPFRCGSLAHRAIQPRNGSWTSSTSLWPILRAEWRAFSSRATTSPTECERNTQVARARRATAHYSRRSKPASASSR
jgi:hypothetical protein